MRFPWTKTPDPPSAAPEPPLRELVRQEVTALVQETRQQAGAALAAPQRMQLGQSPIPGAPGTSPLTSPAQAPYPVYAFDTPIDWSTPSPPQRRPRAAISLQTMRTVADTYDVLRACIQQLKREVMAVPFKVGPREDGDDRRGVQRQVKEMETFFATAGGLGGFGRTRQYFEGMVLEDICVIGSAAAFYTGTRGGGVYQVIPIDAATIRPSVDAWGFPGPGDEIYEQWVWGVLCGRYTAQEMYFDGLPTNARSWSPYCASPVEWLINVVNSALRADDWNRRWLTDGNAPTDILTAPENWTPEQIIAFSQYWDALLSGDSGGRQKMKWAPSGTARVAGNTRKDADFQEFELWLLRRCCAIMGVQPASIGFAGEQYKVSQQDSMESTSAFSVGVLLTFLTTFYNDLCDRAGCPLAGVAYVTAREEKATERATRNDILVTAGIKKINEARQDEGLDPVDGGDTLLVSTLVQPLELALNPPPPPAPALPGPAPKAGKTPAPTKTAKTGKTKPAKK